MGCQYLKVHGGLEFKETPVGTQQPYLWMGAECKKSHDLSNLKKQDKYRCSNLDENADCWIEAEKEKTLE